jgi:transposase
MAMGTKAGEQENLFITHQDLRITGGHPFYQALEKLLCRAGFDAYVEKQCSGFYATKKGRPSIAPGIYFRCLLIGFFEGIDSERGIAWRTADSWSLRSFLGLPINKNPPDHSTLSRTRRLLDVQTHQDVFAFVLTQAAKHGLVKGQSIGVDATTLEANAALKSLVRRENGQGYTEYLRELAVTSGIETPTREDLAKLDRKRVKKGSNKDWVNPHDPDAQIMKMKTGGTHLAHKHEHAVDMETGAILGMSLNGGATGDTKTINETVADAQKNLKHVRDDANNDADNDANNIKIQRVALAIRELTADKGYHSNEVVVRCEESGVRSYISEPKRGRRCWKNKQRERDAVYRNRRRIRGNKGKSLLRRRGELLERAMAHLFNSGGMRRVHLRGHDNIIKRLLVHAAGFNLSLVMRSLFGVGKPRALQGRVGLAKALLAVQYVVIRVRVVSDVLVAAIISNFWRNACLRIQTWIQLRARQHPIAIIKVACFTTAC